MSVHDETDDKLAIDCLLDGVQLSLCRMNEEMFYFVVCRQLRQYCGLQTL